jgi:AcrR family transcriptional regulator
MSTLREELNSFKRERIRGQAERLFYANGYSGTTMDAIAESLRATKPFLYGAYARKTDILVDIHLSVVQRILDAIETARASGGTPTAKLQSVVRKLTAMTLENQAAVAIYFREEAFIPARQTRRINDLKGRVDDGIAALLDEGVASGEFKVDDLRLTALALAGMVSWSHTWYRSGGRLDIDTIGERMARLALRLVGASAATPARVAPDRASAEKRR